ncbi:hypothetical protein Nepgr_020586 [Nepenthes gracilis]|uniref:Uncharacterized protein n=1 Tax=Nepenthes gracilis TaxID=150966 RepID=A0AAD3SX41_NEPGR|nr:hypothetical protein Nepgr_020586 [Nepenthes gracilis]
MAVTEEESSSAQSRSNSNGVHYLAKCVLRSSVVLQVVRGHIRSPTSYDVVFGKETSIELVIIGDDGIVQSVCEQAVFGTIKDLAILPWNKNFDAQNPQMAGKDHVIVLSDSGKVSFLSFCNEMHRFFAVTHLQLSDPGNSRHQVGRMIAVDPSGCYIAVGAYEERLALLSVSKYNSTEMIDKKIIYPHGAEGGTVSGGQIQRTSTSGTVWSMCFISRNSSQSSKEQNPVLAILLNRRGSFLNELLLLEWDIGANAIHVLSQYMEAGPLAHTIVEVPQSYGLALLFRIGDALVMDLSDAFNPCCVRRICLSSVIPVVEEQNYVVDDEGFIAASALLELKDPGMDIYKGDDPMSIDSYVGDVKYIPKYVCSCSWEPGTGKNPRMIFCMDTGEFFMIEILFSPDGLEVNLSDCLYQGLSCKALLWIEHGFLAAIVEMGDGLILKLDNGRLDYTSTIQNIAPILDMSIMDYHNEKHDQMFACCGMEPEGSLRIIRSGLSVERLVRTAPTYQGITGTWTMKMKLMDSYHSFLVLSFVEETRVLSVGLSFTDVTDSVGFLSDVCTLACGLLDDGLLVQIYQSTVRLCLPTGDAHSEGIPRSSPVCTSWSPDNIGISLGSVAYNFIVVATSNPCFLIILGVKSLSLYNYEVCEMQHIRLQCELSCISIPQTHFLKKESTSFPILLEDDVGITFVIGTHRPSVEVLSYAPGCGIRVLAAGTISLTSTVGAAVSGCVPQDVRLVLVDRLYVLAGLRNGMLLRFEWPAGSTMCSSELSSHWPSLGSCSVCFDTVSLKSRASSSTELQLSKTSLCEKIKDNDPVHLQLIAIRRIGIIPVFLVPLNDSLDADIIALSDRPWLVQTPRHSLSYISISFQPSTHVTPVCSAECPKGLLFVSENSLHLVEMMYSRRLNVQKFHLGGTPRKVLYHSDSRLLLVMRTDLSNNSCSSDICCVDPLSGSVLSSFKFDLGETGKCMELVRVAKEQVLIVGTSLSSGPPIMPNGEAESTKGRLIVLSLEHLQNSDSGSMTICSKAGSSSQRASPFCEAVGYAADQMSNSSLCSSPDDNSCDGLKLEDGEAWQLQLASTTMLPGMVLAVCPYLDNYFLASSGNAFYVCGFPNDNPQRVKRLAIGRTRFMIVSLTSYITRIAVGDCRDGILFYSYHEETKKLEQLYCDPGQRLVADCLLMDVDTAVVSDRKGSIAVLTCSSQLEDNVSPECNLTLSCSYYMGEIAMSIRKGSLSYKLPADELLGECNSGDSRLDLLQNGILAGTLLGSIMIFIPLPREEYDLLKAVQARLAVHPLTAPVLGNNHNEYRSRENQVGVPQILDGDMLAQFLELTNIQQEAVLALPCASDEVTSSFKSAHMPISANQVVRLLERVHYALN